MSQNESIIILDKRVMKNVLLAQMIVRDYYRSKITSGCTIKVDLHKSYDSIKWDFIKKMSNLLGFPKH